MVASWDQRGAGVAASLTALNLIHDRLAPFQPVYRINWAFALGGTDNGNWRPEKRAFLTVEVCGNKYIADLVPRYGPLVVFPPESFLDDSGRHFDRDRLNRYGFDNASLATAVYFGEQFFTPLDWIPEGHPYHSPAFFRVVRPGNTAAISREIEPEVKRAFLLANIKKRGPFYWPD